MVVNDNRCGRLKNTKILKTLIQETQIKILSMIKNILFVLKLMKNKRNLLFSKRGFDLDVPPDGQITICMSKASIHSMKKQDAIK